MIEWSHEWGGPQQNEEVTLLCQSWAECLPHLFARHSLAMLMHKSYWEWMFLCMHRCYLYARIQERTIQTVHRVFTKIRFTNCRQPYLNEWRDLRDISGTSVLTWMSDGDCTICKYWILNFVYYCAVFLATTKFIVVCGWLKAPTSGLHKRNYNVVCRMK